MAAGWAAWTWLVLVMGANWGCAWEGESVEGLRRKLMRKGDLGADKDVETVPPKLEEYKYVASLRVPKMLEGSPAPKDIAGQHYCAGVLIASNVVLTAGHCVQNSLKSPDVHVGRYQRNNRENENFEKFSVLKTLVHPDFRKRSDGSIEYDAALLILNDSSQFEPASLQRDLSGSAKGRVLGWGWKKESNFQSGTKTLLAVDVEILREDICQIQFEEANSATLCASESSDGCQIDSGGPLISENVVKGVASSSAGCGRNRIGIYTEVLKILEWIDQILGEYPEPVGFPPPPTSLPPPVPPPPQPQSPPPISNSPQPEEESFSPAEESLFPEEESLFLEEPLFLEESLFPEEESLFPEEGSLFPEEESLFPEEGSLFPEEGSLFPEEGSLFPEEESLFAEEGSLFPEEGSLFPEEESFIPEEESGVYPKIPTNFGETQAVSPKPPCQFWNGHWIPSGCPGG